MGIPRIALQKQLSAERGECLLDRFPKRWNLILDHVPDNVFIEPEVAMSEHVTKSRYLPPFDRRVLKANVLWNLFRGLAKDEEVPEGSIAGQLVGKELLT